MPQLIYWPSDAEWTTLPVEEDSTWVVQGILQVPPPIVPMAVPVSVWLASGMTEDAAPLAGPATLTLGLDSGSDEWMICVWRW